MRHLNRRDLMAGLACSGIAVTSGATRLESSGNAARASPDTTFIDILPVPDFATAYCGLDQPTQLSRSGAQWSCAGLLVTTTAHEDRLEITLAATTACPTHVQLLWRASVDPGLLVLNDAWERSYGDLHWNCLVPERVLPWYFLTAGRESLHGYGVRTGGAALCFWQIDPDGISLCLDVSNGGSGVALGNRELRAATVVTRQGSSGENALDAARSFCRRMSESPRPLTTICGSNDWYYAYGRNTADQIVRDAELMASLAPPRGLRPFTVVDDGWKNRQTFPDMSALAARIRTCQVRPGLWIRPLQAAPRNPVQPAAPRCAVWP
jgi:alpha-galactosidase